MLYNSYYHHHHYHCRRRHQFLFLFLLSIIVIVVVAFLLSSFNVVVFFVPVFTLINVANQCRKTEKIKTSTTTKKINENLKIIDTNIKPATVINFQPNHRDAVQCCSNNFLVSNLANLFHINVPSIFFLIGKFKILLNFLFFANKFKFKY